MKREIIRIDEEKCTGCGECITSCAEGALQIVEGKAKLISDIYCDGLGACLNECPEGALSIEVRDAKEFDEQAVETLLASNEPQCGHHQDTLACGCPGSSVRILEKEAGSPSTNIQLQSELGQWPVQITLVPPSAPYLQNADLLLAADCVPFAYADFHRNFLKDHALLIGCPKLDNAQAYVQKISQIIAQNDLSSLTIVTMEVPCCSGLNRIAEMALERAGKTIPLRYVVIGVDGRILEDSKIDD